MLEAGGMADLRLECDADCDAPRGLECGANGLVAMGGSSRVGLPVVTGGVGAAGAGPGSGASESGAAAAPDVGVAGAGAFAAW